jgi:hypothetical protein
VSHTAIDIVSEPAAPAAGCWPIGAAGTPLETGLSRAARLFRPDHAPATWPYLNPAAACWLDDRLILPVPGFYFFKDGPRTQALIATSASPSVDAAVAFSFVAGMSSGLTADSDAFFRDPRRFFVDPLCARETPVHLNCGPTSLLLGQLLAAIHIASRLIEWVGGVAPFDFHQSLEVLIPGCGWTLCDPHFGLMFGPGIRSLDVYRAAVASTTTNGWIQQYLAKHEYWLDAPWDVYRRYPTGFGIIERGMPRQRVSMLVADADAYDGRRPELERGFEVVIVDEQQMLDRFYS